MSLPDLRSALVQGIQAAIAGSPAPLLPVAWPNMHFPKPSSGPWARCFPYMPASSAPFSLGSAGRDEHLGLSQIDLMHPLDGGEQAPLALAEALERYFYAGRRLTHGSVAADVTRCDVLPGRPDDGWYRTTLSVSWRAFLARVR